MNKTLWKTGLAVVLGIITGYIFHWYIGMDLVGRILPGRGTTGAIITIFFMVIVMVGCTFVFDLILTRTVNKPILYSLLAGYIVLLVYALFYRDVLEREFLLNPLIGLQDALTDSQALQVSILNLVAFIPMGFFFRKIQKYRMVAAAAIFLALAIELIQWFTQWGSFDSFDLIMYFAGMTLGYFFCHRFLQKI